MMDEELVDRIAMIIAPTTMGDLSWVEHDKIGGGERSYSLSFRKRVERKAEKARAKARSVIQVMSRVQADRKAAT